jgi:hypothetical protein
LGVRAITSLAAGLRQAAAAAGGPHVKGVHVDGRDVDGLDLEGLLGVVTPFRRPWLQRILHAAASGLWRRLREAPARAAAWGAGPAGAWCAW